MRKYSFIIFLSFVFSLQSFGADTNNNLRWLEDFSSANNDPLQLDYFDSSANFELGDFDPCNLYLLEEENGAVAPTPMLTGLSGFQTANPINPYSHPFEFGSLDQAITTPYQYVFNFYGQTNFYNNYYAAEANISPTLMGNFADFPQEEPPMEKKRKLEYEQPPAEKRIKIEEKKATQPTWKVIKTHCKSPIMRALLLAIESGVGGSFENQQEGIIIIKNLKALLKYIENNNSRKNPTQDKSNRLKSLRRWFPDFPTKPSTTEFTITINKDMLNKYLTFFEKK